LTCSPGVQGNLSDNVWLGLLVSNFPAPFITSPGNAREAIFTVFHDPVDLKPFPEQLEAQLNTQEREG
jgi:hypothetical protein